MLHYYAERMFSPVMLSPVKTNQTHFRVHIVSNKRYVDIFDRYIHPNISKPVHYKLLKLNFRFQMSNATVDVSVQRYDSLLNQSPPKIYKETLYIGMKLFKPKSSYGVVHKSKCKKCVAQVSFGPAALGNTTKVTTTTFCEEGNVLMNTA